MTNCEIDAPDLMNSKRNAVDQVRTEHYLSVLESNPDIQVAYGHVQFVGPRSLQVGPEVFSCKRFLVACGGVPRSLDISGLSETGFLNSYSALNLSDVPESMIIIGGGVIALEMGQMFQRFGCRTTILERSEYPLAEFDQRLTAQLCSSMANEGLQQLFGVELQYVEKTADGDARIVALINGREATLQAERIMLAVGTEPATKGVGLNVVGVALDDNGFIRTDEYARTTTEGIWAAGDVTGPPLIAPAGELEAEVAVENMFSKKQLKIDHSGTPMAVFVDPEISMVGQDGQAASASGYDVVETYLELSAVAKSYVLGQSTGAFLLWSDRNSGLILGAQVLAPRAADLIHEMAVAVKHKLTVSDIASLVHVYPTISDGWRLLARKCLSALAKVPV